MRNQTTQKSVIVIGAGPGGLTAAMILAHRGVKVTVVEAKPQVGGRNTSIKMGPYTFDLGPTFLMLKDILDEVFREAGADSNQRLDMRRLTPMYRLQFRDKYIEPVADRDLMRAEIRRCFPGREDRYDRFIERESLRFRRLYPCLQKPYHRLRMLLHPDLIRALPHVALGKSLFSVMYDCFGDRELALSFTFQAKYLGMSPWMCPGLFSIIPYIEHTYGVFHPIGGLSRISDVMADVAMEQGADFRLNAPVKRVIALHGSARGVELQSGEKLFADDVVINADFGYAATHLFDPGVLRKYTPQKMKRMKLSCSTFMLYLGLDRQYDIPHHQILFAHDYQGNVDAIFNGRRTPRDISIYIRNASVTDPTLAPAGHSALYVLVPVANLRGEINWAAEGGAFRETVLEALETRAGLTDLRRHVRAERVIFPTDWRDEFNIFEGATFNLAHNLGQMIYLRPHNQFEDLDHCYLVGGGTHPGSGLPTIYESGRIAANLICRKYGMQFETANLEA